MDINSFRNPPKAYGEVPFWSWNDALDPQELRRQVALMDEAGWGGFFMHSRVGLRTPYMSQQWMDCVRACVDEARRRGMSAWLYDEDKWPSGFAGGLSVAPDPSYRLQYLICKVDDRPALVSERIATFAAREVDSQLVDIRPEDPPPFKDSTDRLVQFYPQTMPLGVPWFNDYAYLSLLNPKAVRAFLDSTHQAYAQALGRDMGSAVPGVFTDEPTIWMPVGHTYPGQPSIPWVEDFPAYFIERRGYNLLPHLPSLFFDTGDYHRLRYDYWRTVTQRFVESYTQQIYQWCNEHGIAYTGHYLEEDTLLSQVKAIGAAMPHYPYMHIPGIDKLGRSINTGAGTVLTVKQLDSAVCQTAKPRALCENYGCSGQDFAHTGRKWIGDWAFVLGINLNNPHLALYSMRGERKRDFPQDVFYQQPWWPENNLIASYFARLSYALSQGQRVVDLLVIHPIGSAWAVYHPGATREIDRLDEALDQLGMTLLRHQRDFHYADETLLEPGGATEGRVIADQAGPRLQVGKMAYRLVIVPPSVTLARNTVRLLSEFAAAGGAVLAVEPLPSLIDGHAMQEPVLPRTARTVTVDALPSVLDELLPFDVRVPGRPAVWVHHRRIGEMDCYFLANTDLNHGGPATVQLRGAGRLEAWDPASGDIRALPSRQINGLTEANLDFPPVGSQFLVMHRDQSATTVTPTARRLLSEIPLDGEWQLSLGGPNALTLDTVQINLGGKDKAWSEPMHILDAHAAIARKGVGTAFILRFLFEAALLPTGPVYLVLESPDRFNITVNGQVIPSADAGWWTDIAFRKVEITSAIHGGRNEILVSSVFDRQTELESIYIIGNFGVGGRRIKEENRFNGQVFDRYAPDFRLVEALTLVQSSSKSGGLAVDLTAQGLPFFAGRATLRQTLQIPEVDGRAVLEIQGLHAAIAHVRVNGQDMGTVAWQPHSVDITAGVHPGENTIEIELVGTLRNLLGPHHLSGGDLEWTGPDSFRDKNRWTADYILVPFGLERVILRIEK